MAPTAESTRIAEAPAIAEYLQKSAGSWHSERRYYTLPDGKTQFMVSLITVKFLEQGFATSKPVTAEFYLPNPATLCLRTEYNGSVFEEELKQIGLNYRTRQTIISRAGERKTIGQYLEKRIR